MEAIISKYFQKSVNAFRKVIRHIINDLESSSDDSDDSDEKWMKAVRLMFFEKVIFKMFDSS